MANEALPAAPAPDEQKKKKVKIVMPYTIPEWFQTKCVKSPESLAQVESGLVIKDEAANADATKVAQSKTSVSGTATPDLFADAVKVSDREKEDASSDTTSSNGSNEAPAAQQLQYTVNEDTYLCLKNNVAPTLSLDDDVTAFEQPTGIVIKIESVEGLRHADAAVVQLAKDFSAKLIVLDPEDIEDVATANHAEERAAEKVDQEKQRLKRVAKKAREEKEAAERKKKEAEEKEAERKKSAEEKDAEKKAEEEAEEKEKSERGDVKLKQSEETPDNTAAVKVESQSSGETPTDKAAETPISDTAATEPIGKNAQPSETNSDSVTKTDLQETNTNKDAAYSDRPSASSDAAAIASAVTKEGTEAEAVNNAEAKQPQSDPSEDTLATSDQGDNKAASSIETSTVKAEVAKEDKSAIEDESDSEGEPNVENPLPVFDPWDFGANKASSFMLSSRYFSPVDHTNEYQKAKKRGAATLRFLVTGQDPEPEDDTLKPKSLALQGPVIIHVRNANRLVADSSALKIFDGLKNCIKSCRTIGQKVVLLISIVSNEDPFKKNEANEEDDDDPFGCGFPFRSGGDLMTLMRMLTIDESAIIDLKTAEKIETLKAGHADTQKGIKIQRLKRFLRHGYSDPALDWLDASFDWSILDHNDALAVLEKDEWKDHKVRMAARRMIGRGLAKSTLEFSDVTFVIDRVSRATEEKDDKAKTEAAKKFDERLAKVRRLCNQYEERLLSSVVKPSTLESTYDDVIMDSQTKDTVKQLVSLFKLKTSSKSEKLVKLLNINGAMFFGPPGTGKTHLCKAMASDQNACMLAIDPSSIMDMWVGEQEKLIKASFTLATKLSPCILFIDEADALFRKRTPCDKSWERAGLTMFLQQMDGISTGKTRPFVVVATNRPSDLDDAFLRRLPHKVLFKLPLEQHRAAILRLFVKEDDLDPSVNLAEIAKLTIGFSGSDLKSLCGQAVLAWATEKAVAPYADDSEVDILLEASHFKKALQRTRPTVSQQSLKDVDAFAKQFSY